MTRNEMEQTIRALVQDGNVEVSPINAPLVQRVLLERGIDHFVYRSRGARVYMFRREQT